MASYHLNIKSDKRKNGTQVKASDHIHYIDRTGKFKNIDERQIEKLSYQNTITGTAPILKLPPDEKILYESPFGNIKISQRGIFVSENASIETVAMAVKIASYVYDYQLSFSGNKKFKAKAVIAINGLDLPCVVEPSIAKILNRVQEEKRNEERTLEQIERAGYGRIVRKRFSEFRCELRSRGRISTRDRKADGSRTSDLQPNPAAASLKTIAQKGFHVPALQSSHLDPKRGRPDVLLHGAQSHKLFRRRRYRHLSVRWKDFSRDESRRRVEKTTNQILLALQNDSENIFAESHVQYINRDKAFQKRGGCLYKNHHLPAWAKNDPVVFFAAADRYERANGERYKEIEFSLPNELTLEQQKEIIQPFLDHHLKNHYYAYAIHEKIGAMSENERHPHVHIMFSTREIDDIERQQERQPEDFFKRANKNAPEKGGCIKSAKWIGKERSLYLCQMREDCAKLQNEILKKYNIPFAVDHRSVKARRQAALAEGNLLLAELLDRPIEKPVGPIAILEKDNTLYQEQKRLRKLNRQKEASIFAKVFLANSIAELKIKKQFRENHAILKTILAQLHSEEKASIENELQELKALYEEQKVLWKAAIWNKQAIAQARIAFMNTEDQEIYTRFRARAEEYKNWKKFRTTLDMTTQQELTQQVDLQIAKELKILKDMAPSIQRIMKPFAEPKLKKEMQLKAGLILQENKYFRDKLMANNEVFGKKLDHLQAILIQQTAVIPSEKLTSTIEVSRREMIARYDRQLAALQEKISAARKEVFSYERALAMAKNVYVKGAYSRLRKAMRELKKKQPSLSPEKYQSMEKEFLSQVKTLDERCATSAAKKKIEEIAAGIMRKNAPKVLLYQRLQQEYTALKQQKEAVLTEYNRSHGVTAALPQRAEYASAPAISARQKEDTQESITQTVLHDRNDDEWDAFMTETEKQDRRNATSR